MQTFSQTSQVASASMTKVSPGRSVAGGVTGTGRGPRPVAEIHQRAVGDALRRGKAIGAGGAPSGSASVTSGGPTLPVAEALPRPAAALRAGSNAVLVAPPGAGKTTLVPLVLKDEPWARGPAPPGAGKDPGAGTAPRRRPRRRAPHGRLLGEASPAAPSASRRGSTRLVSDRTRVEVVTEGLLVRRLQSDPGLDGVAAVLFDEAHERNLDTDLALALCLDLQRALRPELRLLAMSATLDGAPLRAPAGRLPGHREPRPRLPGRGRAPRARPQGAARPAGGDGRRHPRALRAHPGDVLAFLPGWGEIRRTAERLGGLEAEVLPLHGELPPAEQDRALNPRPTGGARWCWRPRSPRPR
jgi:ATP-dependent helicase HrpB